MGASLLALTAAVSATLAEVHDGRGGVELDELAECIVRQLRSCEISSGARLGVPAASATASWSRWSLGGGEGAGSAAASLR